jgi:hypothetical protein
MRFAVQGARLLVDSAQRAARCAIDIAPLNSYLYHCSRSSSEQNAGPMAASML